MIAPHDLSSDKVQKELMEQKERHKQKKKMAKNSQELKVRYSVSIKKNWGPVGEKKENDTSSGYL